MSTKKERREAKKSTDEVMKRLVQLENENKKLRTSVDTLENENKRLRDNISSLAIEITRLPDEKSFKSEQYGKAFEDRGIFSSLPQGDLLCDKCREIYDNVIDKQLVSKDCSWCGQWEKWVLSCRRHSLCACSMECAEKLANKYRFSLLSFDGAHVDDDGEIVIPEYHL